jgi:hypothetical protein
MTPQEYKLREDLKFSKSAYMPWGRQVIRCIDFDECMGMCHVFEMKKALGAHVDVMATSENYGGYVWTAWITSFVGDTALHMALRQNKMKCAYMLIAMGALTDLENSRGQTAEDLIVAMGKTVREMELDAFRNVIPLVDPTKYHYFPKHTSHKVTHANFSTVEREAWDMMMNGRSMYSEVPLCFAYDDIIPDPKGAGKGRPRKWAVRYDNKAKRKYRIDAYSGDIEWLAEEEKKVVKVSIKETPVVLTAPPPNAKKEWSMAFDENGQKYYSNSRTGESQWEMPDALKSKSQLEKEASQRNKDEKERKKKERAEKGLPPEDDSDEEYSYKKGGESDEEDEEALIRAAKAKRQKEEEDKEKEKTREADEKRMEWSRRNQDKRKAQRAHEVETGINICSGATATSDVWGKNRVTDTILMLRKQRLRQKRLNDAEAHRLSGLTLMDAAEGGENPGLSAQLMRGLRDMKGVQKLKFGKLQSLKKLAREIAEAPDPRGDLELPYRFVTVLSTRTNLKAMSVSDFGLKGMALELIDDRMITNMDLFSAGVSLKGCQAFGKTLPTMRALTALNLSGNAIDDEGAIALAQGLCAANEGAEYDNGYEHDTDDNSVARKKLKYGSLLGHLPLIKLSLSGNRITLPGARAVVQASLDDRSTLRFVSLTNNFIRTDERNELAQLCGPHYDHTRGGQRYAKRYAFPGPGGKIMPWPFFLYPFKRHPMHPSNNPTPDEVEYYIRYENNRKPLSGHLRGDPFPQSGSWLPLELRNRYADRENARVERELSLPREKAERRSMNDEDKKEHYVSNARALIAQEEEEKEGAALQNSLVAAIDPKKLAQYTEAEIAANPSLQQEAAAMQRDDKVTSMTTKNDKILRDLPRFGEDTQPAAAADVVAPETITSSASDADAARGGGLKSVLKKGAGAGNPLLTPVKSGAGVGGGVTINTAGDSRRVLFSDQIDLSEAVGAAGGAGDDEREAAAIKREHSAYLAVSTSEEGVGGAGEEGSALYGQETVYPGLRGPAHLRELDILM